MTRETLLLKLRIPVEDWKLKYELDVLQKKREMFNLPYWRITRKEVRGKTLYVYATGDVSVRSPFYMPDLR